MDTLQSNRTLEIDILVLMNSVNETTVPPDVSTEHMSNYTDFSLQPHTELAIRIVQVLNSYVIPIVCSLGIIGDVTSFLIFVFTSFRYQPCSQYLASLTFVDTLFLIANILSNILYFLPSLGLIPGYCHTMVFFSYVCSFLSAWFIVLMMVERYIVVCHPFKVSSICSRKTSIILISTLTSVAVVVYFHTFLTTTYGHHCEINPNFWEFYVVFTYFDIIITFTIPFFSILFLNLKIILTVRKFRLRHILINKSLYGNKRFFNAERTLSLAQVHSTKMLVRVSSVFLVLYLPSYALRLYILILQKVTDGQISDLSYVRIHIAQTISQFLYTLNFAVDFIVYVATSNNFRRHMYRCLKDFSKICRQRCAEKKSSFF